MASKGPIPCPHCEQPTTTLTSKMMSRLVREIWVDCTNYEACGWRGVVQTGVVRTIVESEQPHTALNLPLVARRANDIVMPVRNGKDHQHAAATAAAPAPSYANGPAPMALN